MLQVWVQVEVQYCTGKLYRDRYENHCNTAHDLLHHMGPTQTMMRKMNAFSHCLIGPCSGLFFLITVCVHVFVFVYEELYGPIPKLSEVKERRGALPAINTLKCPPAR